MSSNPAVIVTFSLLPTSHPCLMVRILLYKFIRDFDFLPTFFIFTPVCTCRWNTRTLNLSN